jgi:hypothetical protein
VADTPAELLHAKDRARTALADGYAEDLIDQDELDERLDAVERARTVADLEPLMIGLTNGLTPSPARMALVPVSAATPERIAVLLGSLARNGAWEVSGRTRVRVVLGAAILDLRTATLPDGPIELDVSVVLGSLDVFVPPGWQIDTRCGAILASVEQDDSHAPAPRERRVLRVTGRAVLGSVAIHERLPGEGASDARRRRRRERKALAEQQARALPPGERP